MVKCFDGKNGLMVKYFAITLLLLQICSTNIESKHSLDLRQRKELRFRSAVLRIFGGLDFSRLAAGNNVGEQTSDQNSKSQEGDGDHSDDEEKRIRNLNLPESVKQELKFQDEGKTVLNVMRSQDL
jgi:hypothetical protein